jgi:hypothetical protein
MSNILNYQAHTLKLLICWRVNYMIGNFAIKLEIQNNLIMGIIQLNDKVITQLIVLNIH